VKSNLQGLATMEMHQVRYFLAVSRTLNFTRAAEECNVSQPALTRAIQQLEQELAGKLLRREGKLSHLTELGQRMLPLMQQCYESALAAKTLATSIKKGAAASLTLALSPTIDLSALAPCLTEVRRVFPGLQLQVQRGTASELGELLKKGQVEFAMAGPLGQEWERLDVWPLFEEGIVLAAHKDHPLAGRNAVGPEQLAKESILINPACESAAALASLLQDNDIAWSGGHEVGSQGDLLALLEANLGIGFLPQSALRAKGLRQVPVDGLEVSRKVFLYGVAGRQRSAAAEAFLKLVRAHDWLGQGQSQSQATGRAGSSASPRRSI
jgi:DNA-binding transcriptional LysR family regulator